MKNILSLIVIIIIITQIYSPLLKAQSEDVRLSIDYGRFRYDSSSVYLEVYYAVYPCSIQFQESSEGYKAECALDFALLDMEADSVLVEEKIPIKFQKQETELSASQLGSGQMGVLKLIVPEGKYNMRMISPNDTVFNEVSVKSFQSDKIAMSDLQMCSNIVTSFNDQEHPFYKNTMKVVPNPSVIYGDDRPLLYYYVEIYNIKTAQVSSDAKIFVQTVVADKDGQIRLKKEYPRSHAHESTVERGMFNISKLESGLYTLIFAVVDSVEDVSVFRRRNFYVHNPNVIVIKTDEKEKQFLEEFLVLTEKQLDDMFDQANYIATESERQVFKQLNSVESKRQFLATFWASREKEQEGWKNEYYDRVFEANEKFGQGGIEGWMTDMGRVFIVYGPADEYERSPMSPNENPYEIWHYLEIEGGVEFDFVDINGYGIFQLVNSTKRGEISYTDWQGEYVYSR
jgi:GWxTD domain-containing protein